jgi:cell division protein FtsZ
LATAEARGEHRVREVSEKLLAHPLLDGGQALAEAEGVLVSIAGGPDLAMMDVNRIMEALNRHCERAHIIMGAAIDEALAERLCVTLVASRGSGELQRAADAEPPDLNRLAAPEAARRSVAPELDSQLEDPEALPRPASRFVAPPPALTPERAEQLLKRQAGGNGRQRRQASRLRQGQLALEIVTKGRFEKSEPTIRRGEDLDVPTYIRRGVALN